MEMPSKKKHELTVFHLGLSQILPDWNEKPVDQLIEDLLEFDNLIVVCNYKKDIATEIRVSTD